MYLLILEAIIKGTNDVIIGDGSSSQINGIGDTNIKQMIIMLPLKHVLFVLELIRNLLSVNQLTTQHPVNCEFSNENTSSIMPLHFSGVPLFFVLKH
jgi:hypothetical protein